MRISHIAPMPRGGTREYGGEPHYGCWHWNRKGQQAGKLMLGFRGRNYGINKLVCEAFHGPKPFARAVAYHLDGDTHNNRAANLAWGTQKQNLNKPTFIAYCESRTGENHPRAKGMR